MILTVTDAARATSGRVIDAERFPARLRITTDTRTLAPGDTFLALRGEHFDGHDYVAQAVRRGAAALIIDAPGAVVNGIPALLVADTKRAYMALAAAAREAFSGQVIGITGSAGKTTTKHLLAQLLSAYFGGEAILASPANENNEIGVSKLLLAIEPVHRIVVVEMGARHQGDIADLVRIARPHIGVLTNIGDAHLEIFGSREGLARTKWGLFSLGAQAVLNARDSECALRAATLPAPPLWFGAGEPGPPGVYITEEPALVLTHGRAPLRYPVDLRLPGHHNRANLAAAISAALLIGVPPEHIVAAVPELTLPAGRYETIALQNGVRLIYDAYNANTAGMIAALDAFADEEASRRIAVLASMAEIGSDAPAMHERVGAHAAGRGIDMLLAGGEYAQSLVAGARAAGLPEERVLMYEQNAQAAKWLATNLHARDIVLLKGSRKYQMEEIVAALRVQAENGAREKR